MLRLGSRGLRSALTSEEDLGAKSLPFFPASRSPTMCAGWAHVFALEGEPRCRRLGPCGSRVGSQIQSKFPACGGQGERPVDSRLQCVPLALDFGRVGWEIRGIIDQDRWWYTSHRPSGPARTLSKFGNGERLRPGRWCGYHALCGFICGGPRRVNDSGHSACLFGRGHPPFRGAGGSSLHSQSAAPTGQCRHHRPDGGAGWRQRGVKQLNAFWSCLAFHTFVYCYARLSENYASLNNALRERWCCRLGGGGPPGKHSPHKGLSSRPEGDASPAFSPGFGRTACTASSAGRDCGEIGAGSDRQVRTKLTSVKSGTCEWKKTPRTGERCRRYPGTSPASPERKDAPPMPR